jgi:hypothetical protein
VEITPLPVTSFESPSAYGEADSSLAAVGLATVVIEPTPAQPSVVVSNGAPAPTRRTTAKVVAGEVVAAEEPASGEEAADGEPRRRRRRSSASR